MTPRTEESRLTALIQRSAKICAMSEICEYDMIAKLTAWKATSDEVYQVLEALRKDGYLDDERYAKAFARGKNHQLKWGRTKIAYQLKMKRIDQSTIDQALFELNDEQYMQQLLQIAQQKWKSINEADRYTREGKLTVFLQSKGYEMSCIRQVISQLD